MKGDLAHDKASLYMSVRSMPCRNIAVTQYKHTYAIEPEDLVKYSSQYWELNDHYGGIPYKILVNKRTLKKIYRKTVNL